MRKIIQAAILIGCASLISAQGLVTINSSPPYTAANGRLENGFASIQWQSFTTAAGVVVPAGATNIAISSGVFTSTVQLYPNVGATPPGTSYTIIYNFSGSPVYTRHWYIPASASPVNVVSVEFPPSGLVGTTAIVSPAQLTQAGATVNQPLCWNGAMWAPGSCGGGSGGGPAGSVNQIQTNSGSGSFAAIALGGANTVLHGNSPATFSQVVTGDIGAGAVNLTTQVNGILPVANGGTGTNVAFTPGSVIFAGTGGTFQQANNKLFFDQADGYLGINTTTPGSPLTIQDTNNNNNAIELFAYSGQNVNLLFQNGLQGWVLAGNSSGTFDIFDGKTANETIRVFPNTDDVAICARATDGFYSLDVQCSSSGGTARIFDQTSSGLTRAVIQGGAAQGIGDLLDFITYGGTNIGGVISDGTYWGKGFTSISNLSSGLGSALNGSFSYGLSFSNSKYIVWSPTTTWYSSPDTGIARSGAGTVEVNNGTSGQRYGTSIQSGSSLIYDNTPSTGVSQTVWQAGAGQGSNDLAQWKSNSGSVQAGVDNSGDFYVLNSGVKKAVVATGGSPTFGFAMSSDASVTWKNVSDINTSGVWDTGLSRLSAGLIGVGNATQGDYSGSLQASGYSVNAPGGNQKLLLSNDPALKLSSDSSVSFFNGANIAAATADTAMSRISAGVVGIGSGAVGNVTGSVSVASVILNGSSSGVIGIKTAAAAGTWTATLPTGAGSSGQLLQTDGTGVLNWVTVSGTGTVTNVSNNLTAGYVVVGNGGADITTVSSSGTTVHQLLHANPSGNPTWSAVALASDVSGTLPFANGGLGTNTNFTNHYFFGNNSGSTGAPSASQPTFADLAAGTVGAKAIFPGGDLFIGGIDAQTGTTYTVLAADENKLLTFNNSGSVAITLPVATTSGFTVGAQFHVYNIGAGTATITPTTSTINGGSSLALTQGQGALIVSDGTNYSSWVSAAPTGSGTVTSIVFSSPLSGGTVTTTGTVGCATCVTSAASLAQYDLLVGTGSQGSAALGSLGTNHQVLHGNASGLPSWSATNLSTDVTGTLAVSSLPTPYTSSISSQTSVSISAATHGMGIYAVAFCFDNSATPVAVACSYTRDGSGNMVFSFNPAWTGTIEVHY